MAPPVCLWSTNQRLCCKWLSCAVFFISFFLTISIKANCCVCIWERTSGRTKGSFLCSFLRRTAGGSSVQLKLWLAFSALLSLLWMWSDETSVHFTQFHIKCGILYLKGEQRYYTEVHVGLKPWTSTRNWGERSHTALNEELYGISLPSSSAWTKTFRTIHWLHYDRHSRQFPQHVCVKSILNRIPCRQSEDGGRKMKPWHRSLVIFFLMVAHAAIIDLSLFCVQTWGVVWRGTCQTD